MRSLGVQRVPAGGPADSAGLEHGALQQNLRSCFRYFAGSAAHHAGQRDRLLCIGDDQVVGGQLALLAVEGGHRLAFARPPHHDAALGQPLQIERVQRMAQLE